MGLWYFVYYWNSTISKKRPRENTGCFWGLGENQRVARHHSPMSPRTNFRGGHSQFYRLAFVYKNPAIDLLKKMKEQIRKMPRRLHRRSPIVSKEPGMYHLYARQINGDRLFYRQSDFKKLLSTIEESRKRYAADIIMIVCMTNHFHMIVQTDDIMGFKTYIARRYCGWYNVKHNRRGPLLYDSTIKASPLFYREAQKDKILYNANNPVKAGLCKSAFCYRYSSLRAFTKNPGVWKEIIAIDTDIIIRLFGSLEMFRVSLKSEIDYKRRIR